MDAGLAALVLSSVKAAANSASQEAGKHVWEGLAALIRRARRRSAGVMKTVEPRETAQPEEAAAVAAALVEEAGRDPRFEADLRAWIELAGELGGGNDAVTNTIGEGARVRGNVVQARDIGGSVTFN
ncbi:MAG TPA: hypothetical protein VFN97_11665 [Actinospica sp.]|nr:hypothetical protein [Actinospica sp.]